MQFKKFPSKVPSFKSLSGTLIRLDWKQNFHLRCCGTKSQVPADVMVLNMNSNRPFGCGYIRGMALCTPDCLEISADGR